MLLMHFVARALRRTVEKTGKRIAISTTMMAMTTSISTSVKPRLRGIVPIPAPSVAAGHW